jgi:hypothetical protein
MPKTMLRIDRDKNNVAVAVFKFLEAVLEGEDFGRTDEGEGGGDEKND